MSSPPTTPAAQFLSNAPEDSEFTWRIADALRAIGVETGQARRARTPNAERLTLNAQVSQAIRLARRARP